MKKLTLTALTTALCSVSIVSDHVVSAVAQQPAVAPATAPTAAPTTTPGTTPAASPTPTKNPQAQLIEQLKLTKDQQLKLEGVIIIGLTAIGRTTVKLLQLNSQKRLAERQNLIS